MRTRGSSPDSSGDSNATTCRADAAHNDTQDRGASTPRPAPWSELIRKRSEVQVLPGPWLHVPRHPDQMQEREPSAAVRYRAAVLSEA